VRAFAAAPGASYTELARYLSVEECLGFGVTPEDKPGTVPKGKSIAEGGMFKSLEQGAATTVWCAASSQLDGIGGVYCEDVDVAAINDTDAIFVPGVAPFAVDPEAAKRLWALSEELTGVKF
jgi:hypothetical protein